MNKRTRGGPPQRRLAKAAIRPSILVFTEGKKTEPIYLNYWRRVHRQQVLVDVSDEHGPPLTLVKRAVAQRATDERQARYGKGAAYSEYWCVFDIDEHPDVRIALELAESKGIQVAVTNPCVELWFLLHFEDQRAAIDRVEAQRKIRDLLRFEKVPTHQVLEDLVVRYVDARRRAIALDTKHELDGSPYRSNPSSEVWHLVDRMSRT
jgi:hypothetical protein